MTDFNAYTAALIQLNSTPDLDANLTAMESAIRKAAGNQAQFILLPECSPFLGPEAELRMLGEQIYTRSKTLLDSLSTELQTAIAAGIYRPAEDNDGRIHNTLYYTDQSSGTVFEYDKIHLFDVTIPDGVSYQESRYIAPGRQGLPLLTGTAWGQLGFSICYDLRFAEMYRALSRAGAQVLLIPAAFTAYTGRAHWRSLLQARAIENAAWVLAPAQCGLHFGKRESWGHSMVISPWGKITAELGPEPGILYAKITAQDLQAARNRIPAWQGDSTPRYHL
ncbi:MAG: carbon-nitrogen hydrolase family protein [Leptospiraceae bacterium]|nr:carbon-nitrogen hydrolase family protein [Leptospiraceae bacterium]